MEKIGIQKKILRKLMSMKPAKWGNSHTELKNLTRGFPSHLRGSKIVLKAIEELFIKEFLTKSKKTNEWHVSLNPGKTKEIFEFLELRSKE